MKSVLFILMGACIFFSSCSRSNPMYFSFYNISKNKTDISYSFNNNEYSFQLNPGKIHTQEFKEDFRAAHIYSLSPDQPKGIVKDIIVNKKVVVPVFSGPRSFGINLEHFFYNFIIDDDAIYLFQFYPVSYQDGLFFLRSSLLETVNYWMIDFVKNNKNYEKYCGDYYWKNCMKLKKLGSRN